MSWLGTFFSSSNAGSGQDLVGHDVELGNYKVHVKRVIAEGGYGYVYHVQDTSSSKEYALKRLMAADETSRQDIMNEVSYLRKLRGHPNILQFIAAASGEQKQSSEMKEYLILTEFCRGQVSDFLQKQEKIPLPKHQVLKLFSQTCRAVAHMHKQKPPIIHRDLKIENLLFSSKGTIKLCDFGSSTTTTLYPDDSWTAIQRSMAEDEIQRNTTPMYRSPEMIDLYSNYPVTVKSDIWALGCILFLLCYLEHPFEDSAKLKIINANYQFPENDTRFQSFHQMISSVLKINPIERPDIDSIYAELIVMGTAEGVDINSSIIEQNTFTVENEGISHNLPSSIQADNQASNVIIGNMVNKAGALFSNIKDASSKLMQSVAGYARNDLDISYITSRILVMSFPADGIEATYKNNIDDVRAYLDTHHTDNYVVINISQRSYRTNKLNDRVFESGWNPKRVPSLDKLVSLCRKINNFLKQNKKNVVVIHCLDGRSASSFLITSFFIFCKLFTETDMGLDLFNQKRFPLSQSVQMFPSQKRYVRYVGRIVSTPKFVPHKDTVFLKSLDIAPVPIFNKARNGCRPLLEIYQNGKRILNTAQEIDQMREYTLKDHKIIFQTHVRLNGDITIFIHHGRSTLGGKVQGKLTSINIFSIQFHTGFLEKDKSQFNFTLSELDIQETLDKYPSNFRMQLNVKHTNETGEILYTCPWERMHVDKLSPYVCFTTKEEYWNLHEEFNLSEEKMPSISSGVNTSDKENNQDETSGKEGLLQNDETVVKMKFENGTENTYHESNYNSKNYNTASIPIVSNVEQLTLIDIGSPKLSNIDSSKLNNETFSSLNTDSGVTPINVEDSFLLSDISSPTTSKEYSSMKGKEDSFLLDLKDFDSSPNLLSCDLINSTSIPNKQGKPDLLPKNEHFTSKKKNRSVDDLNNEDFFASLETTSNTSNTIKNSNEIKHPVDPFMKNLHDSARKSNSESNLLADWDGMEIISNPLKPEITLNHSASSSSLGDSSKKSSNSYDPFADLDGFSFNSTGANPLKSASFVSSSSTKIQPQSTNQKSKSNRSSPTSHLYNSRPQNNQGPNYNIYVPPSADPSFLGNTSFSHKKTQNNWVPKAMKTDEFSDILNAQGFVSFNEQQQNKPTTLKQLQAQQDTDSGIDPIRIKIREWADGKERNIRSLLTSLHTVLWESENKWQPIGMNQLIQPSSVKKFYRKACLCIHPDKHTGEPHEDLARAIFLELNEAWSLFEDSGSNLSY